MSRKDGRAKDQLRPVNIIRNYLPQAEGSVLFELGNTKVICTATVDDKAPTWLRGSGQGWVTAEYSMLPRATSVRTVRESVQGKRHGRTVEIQRLIGRALRSVVDLKRLGGEVTILLDCDVVQADGGTRTAAITGGFIALYDAIQWLRQQGRINELPVSDFIAATSVGVVGGQLLLDLDFSEDSQAGVDANVVMCGAGALVEVQASAEKCLFHRSELDDILSLAQKGIRELIARQRSVLLEL